MPWCIFDRNTGVFVSGTRYDQLPHDPAVYVQIELPEFPDPALTRWDGASGVRPATPLERANHIDSQKTAAARTQIDSEFLRAVTRALLDEIDTRHTTNPVDRAAFRQRALDYLKALL